jgi:hypothetical protein
MKKIALFLLIACLKTVLASAAESFLPRDTIFMIAGNEKIERKEGVIIDIPLIVDTDWKDLILKIKGGAERDTKIIALYWSIKNNRDLEREATIIDVPVIVDIDFKGNLIFTTGGGQKDDKRLIITQEGLVGIGNSNPTCHLDVVGNANITGRVSIGTSSFPALPNCKLAIGGGIIAEEVLVELKSEWPDYVFEPGYRLNPLTDVERYIAEKKHLPGVASAIEIAANGLNVGELQKVQMEKIEEIYLHLIELEKKIMALQAENEALKTKVDKLERR